MFLSRLMLMFLASLMVLSNAYAGEPRNLAVVKQDLIRYHDSGEYEKDIARVDQQALAYLKSRVAKAKHEHQNKKLAIILDIDETALSNYDDMVAMDFGGTSKEIDEAEAKGEDTAILPTLDLYQYAKAHNVAVFFITARKEKYRAATESNLEKAGYTKYDGLYLLPDDYKEKSVTDFKTNTRKKIIEEGYDIVLSLSDQKVDLRGGYADKAFKLPNPYYLVE